MVTNSYPSSGRQRQEHVENVSLLSHLIPGCLRLSSHHWRHTSPRPLLVFARCPNEWRNFEKWCLPPISIVHSSRAAVASSLSLAWDTISVPCRPNKKNSTVKTDQNQLNKKSTHHKSIHQNVKFTTFELNKSHLNKWPIHQMPIHQPVNSTSQQKSPE